MAPEIRIQMVTIQPGWVKCVFGGADVFCEAFARSEVRIPAAGAVLEHTTTTPEGDLHMSWECSAFNTGWFGR